MKQSNTSEPLIEILMATYNGEKYIREQIESIQGQTYTHWKLLISDDCSSDHTLDIVREMAAKDSRITIVSQGVRFGGALANFMDLARKSTAPLAMFSDQDDVWMKDKIRVSFDAISQLQEECGNDIPLTVFTDIEVVDKDLKTKMKSLHSEHAKYLEDITYHKLISQNFAQGHTMIMNHALIDLLCKTKEDNYAIMHDYLALLVAAAFGKAKFLYRNTALYRQHGENVYGVKRLTLAQKMEERSKKRDGYYGQVYRMINFMNVYGDMLKASDRKRTEQYIAILKSKTMLGRYYHLIRCGSYHPGFQHLSGQLLFLLKRPKSYDEIKIVEGRPW